VNDESIDLLMNSYMFDLLSSKDTDTVLNEFVRVLKAGGRMVVVNMTHGRNRASRVYEVLSRRFPRKAGGCRAVQLAETIAQHGFEIDSVEYLQQCLFPSEIIAARKAMRP
jgi:ubiquinone/menaquinone biosynthesis C-methylase UbiE